MTTITDKTAPGEPGEEAIKPTPALVLVFPNGNIATCSGTEQIPELQKSVAELWAEHAERLGYDPDGTTIRFTRDVSFKIRRVVIDGRSEWSYHELPVNTES